MSKDRFLRACLSLEGLSIGDAFGQQFFMPQVASSARPGQLPPAPWGYTDDTEMAIALTQTLRECETVDQDVLARHFAECHEAEPYRGYGAGARQLLTGISSGGSWQELSREMFGGGGSYGNGAAMRVAPLGAWFADDVQKTIEQAALSAEVTHAHREASIGAIAVALAAGWAFRWEDEPAEELIPWVISHLEACEVRRRLEIAAKFPLDMWPFNVASQVGYGLEISSQDTVPYCLWMAAAFMDDYEEAMWNAVRVGGDIDTTCAIVGGIVALRVGPEGIPAEWKNYREPLAWSGART